jgi:hypothetical protein
MSLRTNLLAVAVQLDKAIETGLTAAYPMVLNLPVPEGGVRWKEKVKLGWKLVKKAGKEVVKATVDEWERK